MSVPEEKPTPNPQSTPPPVRPNRVPSSRWLSSPAATTLFPRPGAGR
ncbi:hypothetical protein [Micromonospora sp. DT227]